jgi:hypothetical protein
MAGQRHVWVCGLLPLLIGACNDNNQRFAALQKKTDDMQAQVKSLKESVDRMESDRSWDKLERDAGSIAYLTPGSQGYSTIGMDLGRLTVQLANVQAYANGIRVTLRFGNSTSATINGVKATLEWGRVDAKGSPINDEARSREVTFDQSLRAGAWTEVHVVLDGVPPQEFGFVRVRDMSHTGIVLYK